MSGKGLNVFVSDRHFKQAMTGGAKSNQIIRSVCLVLILEVAASFDMMNIQMTPARAALGSAVLAYLVTVAYVFANSLPVSTMRQFFSTPIVWAILASHKLKGTFTRTKTTPILSYALEHTKSLSAVLAVQINGCYQAIIGTPGRAMPNRWALSMKPLTTSGAVDIDHLGTTPSLMAFARTKKVLFAFDAIRRALKCLAAMIASQGNALAERVYRALSGAVIDGSIIGLELFPALEARLDH